MTQDLPEGTVTVLFTNVEGSADPTTRRGDEAAREVLRACDELVGQQVARHRGQEVKGTGDGLMVAFTSARRAVACAVDVQQAIAGRNRREPERPAPLLHSPLEQFRKLGMTGWIRRAEELLPGL